MTNEFHLIPANEAGSTTPTGVPNSYTPTGLTNNGKGFLEQFEGDKPLPYVDGSGNATVGIGFNLHKNPLNQQVYLQNELGLKAGTAAYQSLVNLFNQTWNSTQDLLSSLNAVYALPSLTAAQISDMWNWIVLPEHTPSASDGEYQKFLNIVTKAVYNVDTTDLLESKEGVALFSLSYNAVLADSPRLLGDLNQAAFNRPDAWFQIRYNSNGGTSDNGAVAARRYAESEVFGLYGPGAIDTSEALAVYAELSATTTASGQTNRQVALNYENTYTAYPDTTSSGTTIVNELNQANDSLGSSYITNDAPAVAGTVVGTLDDELDTAFGVLWQQYLSNATLNPFATGYLNLENDGTVSSLDMQVALTQGGSKLVASQRNGYQLNTGSASDDKPSVLIAQGGDDTLDGSGNADDALIGGSAEDTFYVGDGNDYIVAGTGDAVIGGGAAAGGGLTPMGSGSDTIVLGDPQQAKSGSVDTVLCGTGPETFYLAANDSDVIVLNNDATRAPVFNIVDASGASHPLAINATALAAGAPGTYIDTSKNTLVLMSKSADGTQSVKVIGLGGASSSQGDLAPQAISHSASPQDLAPQTDSSSSSGGVLEFANFQGTSDAGITLNSGSTTTPGASNLGDFSESMHSNYTEYKDYYGAGSADSMYGANTTGGIYNVLEGEGIADYIYAGDGNNNAFAGDVSDSPAWMGGAFSSPRSVVIQGGSGAQLLVGMTVEDGVGNGNETIIGGDVGQDTTVWTTIDGGGPNVNALLAGGTQNSFIVGGAGTDTIAAGSAAPASGQPAPITIALAGLTFWGYYQQTATGGGQGTITGEPEVSIPGSSDPADFQVDIALNQLNVDEPVVPPDELGTSYGAPFGLLGSEWDTGTTVSMWVDNGVPVSLPGSLLIGGDGEDYLIGNAGNDTIVGGTPVNLQEGLIDEVLVGAGGADVIYGGGGNDLIFADLSPGADPGWADLDPSDADTIYGGTGNQYIYGSGGNDVIYGGSGNYTIYTGNGNAYVETGSGNTIVNGGSGADTIIAGTGMDSITTGSGNDSVYSGDGQSTISMGSGSDTLVAGSGTAIFTAGTGAETYQIGAAAGDQIVEDSGSASSVVITYTDGISSGDVSAQADENGDLFLTNNGTGSYLMIEGYFKGQSNVSVNFSDGVTWGAAQILAEAMTSNDGNDYLIGYGGNATITGGPGNDTLIGVSGNNVLTGGTGNSTIIGGSGADTIEGGAGTNDVINSVGGTETYLFNLGDGPETISERATVPGADTLEFGSGIDPSQVTFSHVLSGQYAPDALLISLNDADNSTITVASFFEWWYENDQEVHQIGAFKFADGTTLTADQVLAQVQPIVGTTGNDTLYGSSGPDVIDGKGGEDSVDGNGGSDTFVFNAGYGQLAISAPIPNFDGQGAQSVLQLGSGITASNLTAKAETDSHGWPNGLVLTDGIAGDQISLQGFNFSGNADQSNTIDTIDLADGTTLTKDQLIQMELADSETTGSDALIGGPNADYIDGKGGGDLEEGFGGNDTFVFKPGYGKLEIDEQYSSGQNPVLHLGPGITTGNLQVRTDEENVFLDDDVSGDEVKLDYMWMNGIATPGADTLDGVQAVQLADGTTLTLAQLAQMEVATGATTGNDTLIGTSGADLLDGKGGSDSVIGGGGSDTFIFNAGYGDLDIKEQYLSGQQPVLKLGAGITESMLHLSAVDGYDFVITDGISGDQITLEGMANSSITSGIEELQLADGTVLTRDQLLQMTHVLSGTSGNDTLTGTQGADYFDGKGGSDIEDGDGGSDTFVFNPGYGKLEVNENYTYGQQAVLLMGEGITAATIHAVGSGYYDEALVLTDGIAGDQITLPDMLESDNGIQEVQFADGSTLTRDQLIQMQTTGTTGNETLWGTAEADYFDGKGGDDVEYGEGGQDTFVFNPGYGQLDVNGSGTLMLGAGISESNLHVRSNGGSFILTDGLAGDSVTLEGAYYDELEGDASISAQLADGTVLNAAQLTSMEIAGGTTGSDSLYGTVGADYFDGKGGDDVETGKGGNDTFVFNAGYGYLTISDASVPGSSTLQLGTGITSTQIKVTEKEKGDVIITDGISGDQITILSFLNSGVKAVEFADGSTLSQSQIIQMASDLTGTAGSDLLVGTTGADAIDGKGGNDVEMGNGGNDTFIFNQGYGVLEVGAEDGYTLKLGPGITASDLGAYESDGDDGDALLLTDGTPGDLIRLDGTYGGLGSGVGADDTVQFADGSTLTLSQLNDETQYYYNGVETYRIGAESANQTIWYSSNTPEIDIFYVDGISSTDITARSDVGGDLLLTNKSTGAQLRLVDYFSGGSEEGNAVLHFSDGSTWENFEINQAIVAPDEGNDYLVGADGNDTITGGPGNDTIVGVKGANILTGGTGNSTIQGGSGADTIEGGTGTNQIWGGTGSETYLFNIGNGSDTITENTSSSGTDALKFGSGISASDVAFSLDSSGDLLITFGAESASTIDIVNFTSTGTTQHHIGTFRFADGTSFTPGQVLQMTSSPNLTGTTGNDLLVGAAGADLLDGKGGDDTEIGGGGNDTFVFDAGYGDLEINESYASGQQPVLEFGAGISTSMLRVSADGNNLVLTDGTSGDQITLDNENTSGSEGIALIQLADGWTLSAGQLIQMSHNIYGTTGGDTLTGTSGAELIDGEGGNDSVTGNGGSDTFVFNSGYGDLEVNETFSSGQQPMLQLGPGLAASALHAASDGTNLMLTDGLSGDEITLDGMWSNPDDGVALVQFADDSRLTAAQLMQMEMTGTTGNDTIYGTSGNDLIDGTGGDDLEYGEGGNDTFVFNSGYGHLEVNEGYVTGQQSELDLGAGITASALQVKASGINLVLTDGISGDQVTLDYEADAGYGVALVKLADGTTLTQAQLIQMSTDVIGTPGNDTLHGTSGAELIDGKGGDDSVIGNGGSDTFVFDSGYGQLAINEVFKSGQQPILQFGAGITASALDVTKSGNNMILTDGVSGDQITLVNMWTTSTDGIASVQFADGSTLTRSQLFQLEMTGTTGNDTIYGTSGADLIDGKGGADSIVGSGGSDTFVFNPGYGSLTINEVYTSSQKPVLQFGTGIATSALSAKKSGNNLVLSDGVSGDQITLINMWSTSSDGVAMTKLADGTTLTRAQLIQLEMTGTTSNDTIYGTTGADLIDGKGGNDSVIGSGGNDTFVFNSGYGHLTINEVFTSGQTPVLKLGTGITAAALHVTTNGTNLFLTDGVSGDQITLNTMWTSSTNGVATVKLASGTTFTRSQLIQMEMTGTTGNDTIYGTSGADLIDGKGGSDSITGEGGNDTFVFDSGYGHLTINDTFTSGQTPVLKMGTGITTSNLQVKTSGSNLLLTDGVTGDQVTLIKMATSSTNGVATVQLADGTTLTRSQLLGMETSSTKALIAGTGSSIHDTTGSEATANQTSMPASLGVPDPAPDAVSTGSRTPTLALTPDVTPTASQTSNLLAPGGPATPLNDVVVGAGNLHLSATTPNISSAAGPTGNAQPSRGTKRTDAHLGQPSTAGAQSTVQQAAKGSLQSSTASNDTDQRANSLPSMSTLDTSLGQPRFPAQTQPEDVTVTPGAPADPFLSDIDDPVGGANLPLVAETGEASRPLGAVAQSGIFSPAFGQRQLVNTSSAADAMVKALTGRNGLRSLLVGSNFASEAQDEIRLQGGERWSRSSVDRTLAALPSNGGGTEDVSSRLTDLAHAQLISAMASFRPGASAESAQTIPPNLDTYTIAAAIGMH